MLAPVEFRMRQKMRCLSAHRLADGIFHLQETGIRAGAYLHVYGSFESMDLCSRFSFHRGVTLNYPLAGYSSRGANTVDILSRHARQRWTRLGRYRGLDNGG